MQYLSYFFIPFILSFILTPIVRIIAIKNGLISYPRSDRWHTKPIALLGGIGIFASFLVTYISLFYQNLPKEILGILIGSTLMFGWGLYDDIFNVAPQVKLLGQIIAGCITIIFGVRFNITPWDFLNIIVTLFWILMITNSFNLIDNIDGLSCGISFIVSLMIFFSSLIYGNSVISQFSIILAGVTLGFLPFNFNPAKIFMGDSGSMFLGFTLSNIVILSSTKHVTNLLAGLVVPVLILGVPIFDTTLVTLMRNIYGQSPFKGGKDHTSHRLVSLGLTERKTVLLLYLLSIIFGLIALAYSKVNFIIISILTVLTLIILLFFGIFLSEIKTYDDASKLEEERKRRLENGKTVINTIILHKRRILEIIVDLVIICVSYYSAYLLRYEGKISVANFSLINQSLPWIIIFRLICFYYFGLYRGIWHYISIGDLVSIFKAVSLSSIVGIVFVTFLFRFKDYSRVVFLIDWLLLLLLVSGTRVLIRVLRESFTKLDKSSGKRILIFGADDMGESVLREIKRSKSQEFNPVGFIDDDFSKVGRMIHGIPVLGIRKDIPDIIESENIQEIFLATPFFSQQEVKDILRMCQSYDIKVRRIIGMLDFEGDNNELQ
jgi:UDP-GlcNAc:undecaprenyl-phosphate GlcNAc-1-phosphate transferase